MAAKAVAVRPLLAAVAEDKQGDCLRLGVQQSLALARAEQARRGMLDWLSLMRLVIALSEGQAEAADLERRHHRRQTLTGMRADRLLAMPLTVGTR